MSFEPNIELFLENTRRIRDHVQASPEVMNMIQRAITNGTWFDGTYCRLIPGELGIKIRDDLDRRVAVSVKADLYASDVPMTSFAVVIDHPSDHPLYQYYLVQDLGEVLDVDDPVFLGRHPHLLPRLDQLNQHLLQKGYNESVSNHYHSLGHVGERIVIHDLDCWTMENHEEIFRGAINGKGRFAHLRDIYQRLASPEFSLKVD